MRKILRISKVNNNGTKKRKRKAEALSRKELHSRLRDVYKKRNSLKEEIISFLKIFNQNPIPPRQQHHSIF